MSTQVCHGAEPHFEGLLTQGRFSLTLVGYYTNIDGLAAGGVTAVEWASARDAKRVNELLAMRTIFLHYYETTMRALGQSPTGAYEL